MPVETTDQYVRVRVKNPDLFIDGSFRTIDISADKGIKSIVGKLKTDEQGGMVVQAYLFDKEKWTEDTASKWVEEHSKYSLSSVLKLYEIIPLSEVPKKMVKFYSGKTVSVDTEKKTTWVVASTEEKDRDNEILTKDGWEKRIGTFMKHPVLLSSHNYQSLQSQIGEVIGHKITDNGLEMEVKYYTGEGNAESDWAWVLASKGKAMFSVGFIPHNVLEGDDVPEQYKKAEARRIFNDNELLELSQVVVGSNRGALQLGIQNPTVEQAQYMFDVVKSFGTQIPEFNSKPKTAEELEAIGKKAIEDAKLKADAEIKSIADAKALAEAELEKQSKINKDSFILSPIELKGIKELDQIVSIIKSGRIISKKNEELLQQCRIGLEGAIGMIDQLLSLTNKPTEEGGNEDESDLEKMIQEVALLQKKIKS